MKKILAQKGFHLFIIPLIVVVLGGIGLGSWYVFHAQKSEKTGDSQTPNGQISATPTPTTTPSPSPTPTGSQNLLLVADDKISFVIPTEWVEIKGAKGVGDMFEVNGCTESTEIRPTSNPKMGVDDYYVSIIVCPAGTENSAENWYINHVSMAVSGDETSTASVSGLSTYYFKQNTSSYIDINYAFIAGANIVLVSSRVSSTHYDLNDNIDEHIDLTQYIPAIKTFAESISLKP